jgi:hypothetical protein
MAGPGPVGAASDMTAAMLDGSTKSELASEGLIHAILKKLEKKRCTLFKLIVIVIHYLFHYFPFLSLSFSLQLFRLPLNALIFSGLPYCYIQTLITLAKSRLPDALSGLDTTAALFRI